MPTKNTARETQAQENDTAAGANAVADMTRQQMASTAATTSALLRAVDTLQQAQQHMIQRAALLQEQTADRLRNATSPAEVMSIQSGLVVSGFTELTQYAQELMLATLKAQNEFMRPTEAVQPAAGASVAGTVPLFQAWQAVFTAPLNGAAAARPH